MNRSVIPHRRCPLTIKPNHSPEINLIRMASDSSSDRDLFSHSQDYEAIFDIGSDYADGVTLSESLECLSSPSPSLSVQARDRMENLRGSVSEDEIQFAHLLQLQMIKLEDLHYSSELSAGSGYDSEDIPLDELRETIEDSSGTMFPNRIPEFDRLPNLPYEIVERAR